MTLILQSNKTATRSLGNVDGIIGPRDFSLFSDFSMNRHFLNTQAGRVERSFMDLYSFSRASPAEYIDELGNPASVGSGVPRLFHNIPGTGTRGLLMEIGGFNSFKNPTAPVTQTIPLNNVNPYCIAFSVYGPGSLTITGDITDTYGQFTATGMTLIATEGNPAYAFVAAEFNAPGNINVKVNGSPTFVQVERVRRPWAPSSRITGDNRAADQLSISPSVLDSVISPSGDFTIAMHVVNNYTNAYKGAGEVSGLLEARPIAQAVGAGGDHLALAARITNIGVKDSALRAYMEGTERSLSVAAGVPVGRGWTAVLARGGQSAFGAVDGVSAPGVQTVLPLFKPSKLHLGWAESWVQNAGLSGVVTKVVVYPRFLSPAEIKALSSSWM